MAKFLVFWLAVSSAAFFTGSLADNMMPPKVVCYYDSRSYIRETQAKMLPSDLDPALPYCTHLIYGYAGIAADTHKLTSLNPSLDLDQGHANYRVITQLKRKFPALKILLSVGGDADTEAPEKYNTLVETPEARVAFINSAVVILKNYGFDGIDLAWEFPKIKPKKIRGSLGSFWHGFKKVFSGDSIVDEKSEEHKLGFSKLVQELKNAIRPDNLLLTASVLPSVNSSLYFDTHSIMNYLDFVVLDAFDFYTPERNPKQADYPAPIYDLLDRNPELNANHLVGWWIANGVPGYKLVLGIPAYARTWKMTSDSELAGVPPVTVEGPAPEGPYTKQPGLLSFPEVCSKLTNPNNQKGLHTHLRKVTDPSKRYAQAKMLPSDLEPALQYCTHLVYGYAGVAAGTHKLTSLNPNLDLDQGHGNYRVITQLKRNFPNLKVLLSVGGDADTESTEKYTKLVETPEARLAFINSAIVLLKNYGFDGIDLAWEFPKIKPIKIRGSLGSAWHGFKKVFTGDSVVDKKSEKHKLGFSNLVQELKTAIRPDNLLLTVSVLPNVNSTLYFDAQSIINNLDFVILDGFDYYTPERNPKQADYPASIYELLDRDPELNINYLVGWWLKNDAPGQKLVLGIATHARTWKMISDSGNSGIPPMIADGPAPEGPYTKEEGLLSFPEVCTKLAIPKNEKGLSTYFRKVTDPTKKYGISAYRIPDAHDEGGMWIAYEDPDTTGDKAAYVKAKGLGGIALYDLGLDDFRGLCSGDRFPLLKSAKNRLV